MILDSSSDLHNEAMYSTEPSDAFKISAPPIPDYNKINEFIFLYKLQYKNLEVE